VIITQADVDELARFLANETMLATIEPAAATSIARRVLEAGWRKPAGGAL